MNQTSGRPTDAVGAPAEGSPPLALAGQAQARLAAELLAPTLDELRKDIREVRSHHRTEFIIVISALATGFLVLAGMSIGAYRWAHDDAAGESTRLSTRVDTMEHSQMVTQETLVRVDTKLEDLLARIPPLATPPRR